MPYRAIRLLLCCSLPIVLAGCSVNVQKDKDGQEKRVHIDTPLGNLHVNTDKAPQNMGIGVYPGAVFTPDHDGDKGADVNLGFGEWKLRVQVAHYSVGDGAPKVISWYRNALGRHGDVLECKGNQPVGTPARIADGLTCDEDDHVGKVQVHGHEEDGLTLRAGTKRHQYIVAFDNDDPIAAGPTKFTLIALDLPSDDGKKDRQTD